ncbi:hypothetical protein [Mucilaginibacter phyllosphaerae]|uniref:Lipocalin-like domain-containing protein n=1 Tax=Mucilaginibacter phyllosphaerae TaxID=1812349 RepID=A0A4Y8AJU1_9SPHI|nr:hypothetical protein [Mucilaginibacter phyllosphaerae]MBB3967646.1 hypothetical protein [Mucilaginibacter phyllosphaerae]TEW69298.1 hypothetical protein E2R65_03790 [Mucilaginibacter phyllosphaerae]GGH04239.1 hypothetical protein GCM10007352_07330 [Mucilaginibacter phyllosphaerae]
MRIAKNIMAGFIILLMISCQSKSTPAPTLAGKWNITSALGNDGRHWTGSFTLDQAGDGYIGLFLWESVDGKSSGTDSITGTYNSTTSVLTMKSVVISGNIESVTYTVTVAANSKSMAGTWTGSSDGTVENPGRWTAEKE